MKRKYEIKVRFDENEYLDLMNKVNKSHLSREKYIRSLIKNNVVKEPPPLEYFKLINECNHIGNNLNQLLKLAYVQPNINKENVSEVLSQLHTTINQIDKEIRGG